MADLTENERAAFQAGADLMEQALAGVAPRVPVYAQIHDFAAKELGIPGRVFYNDPEIMVTAILETQARYGLEVPALSYDVYNIEAQGLGQKLLYGEGGAPDIDRNQPLIRTPDDLSCIKTPDFETGRFAQIIQMLAIYQKLTGSVPTLQFCAPFSLAANLVGIENLLVAIYTQPNFVRSLLERLTEEVLAPWILYQKAHFPTASAIRGADAVASIPVVNLAILKGWVAPYIFRLRQLCGPEVNVANWVGEHKLKSPQDMLALKLSVGPGAIQGQDPDVAILGPEFYKQFAIKNQVPLVLGVGAGFIDQSSPTEIRERVRHYVEVGKVGGRFALYLCNISATTPAENVRAAIEAVVEFGAG
jgi:uroporphyrinogen-III decarboxylase